MKQAQQEYETKMTELKAQLAMLAARVTELDAADRQRINWADVGSVGHMVEMLGDVTGHVGRCKPMSDAEIEAELSGTRYRSSR